MRQSLEGEKGHWGDWALGRALDVRMPEDDFSWVHEGFKKVHEAFGGFFSGDFFVFLLGTIRVFWGFSLLCGGDSL